MHWPRITRDAAMFILGAVGFLHEVFVSGPTEHPFLLAASAALMGLPFVFQPPSSNQRGDNPPRRKPRPRPRAEFEYDQDGWAPQIPERRRVERRLPRDSDTEDGT